MADTKKSPRPLTHQQQLFVLAYLKNGGNATDAARKTGYSLKSAHAIGGRLVKVPAVAAAIAAHASRTASRVEITVEKTLRENACIAFADPRRIFGADGKMLPLEDWPDEIAAAISTVEFDEAGQLVKVRWWNKGDALERLFKFQRLYAETAPDPGTTNILNVNFSAMDAEERNQLRALLARALPARGGDDPAGTGQG